ncbi:DUF2567 domain-containing protein [Paractinoplanes brasiliensis]|uniref:Uncharacterized protein n=1 Tax=Paractinoplanes brasiliensis TaxID=52695 RepID=A0A4R6JQM7_9ACTN|nr:DUF2567 domain-containing protein [Actinoplanes brasiliensis]TDO37681.1 hypothetical protein C8E87_1314 [Actinoplanes brasiliensis]GID31749.1 hypothetical protein Abr02nite_67320 [Actinoplanes brasiliensis]
MNPSQEPASHQPGERSAPESRAVDYGYGAPGAGGYGSAPDGGGYGPTPDGGGYGLAHPSGPIEEPRNAFGRAWSMHLSSHRPWKRTLVVALGCFLVIVVLGGPLGLLWRALAPSVPVVDAGQAGIVVNDPSPEEYIAADGWFTLLGLGFGLLVAIVAWLVLRRDRGPFLLLSVVLGALGAGWLVAPRVGELIGRSDYQSWAETAQQGATYMAPPEVHALGPTLVPAFAAAIVLTLLAGWSNDPDLDQPGAKPGYGSNNPGPVGPQPGDGYEATDWQAEPRG